MADNTTQIIFTAQDRASEVMRRLSSNVDRIESSFGKLSAPLLRFQTLWASLVGGAIVAGLRSLVSAIDDLDESAQGLGTTAEHLANLRAAAGEAGVGAETLDTALTRLNVNLSNAASGSKEQLAIFKALGVSIRDAGGNVRPTTEVLADLADRFSRLEDGPAKAALAVDLFGRSGAKLIPLLNQGAAGLERVSGLTADAVREAARLQGEIDKLNVEWERMKFVTAGAVVPALNDIIEVFGRLDFSKIRAEFNSFFLGNFGAAFKEYFRQIEDGARRQQQLREALKLGEGAYSNEGRQALQSAQAVRDKAAADLEAERASKRKKKATDEASNAYAKEFADVARIRANRDRERQFDEDERNRATERQRQRLADLTGQTGAQQWLDDMKALDEAFFSGAISAEKYEAGMRKAFGLNSDTEKGLERQVDLIEQLGITSLSSLGELVTTGGRAGDVWKALGQDLAKIIIQMQVLKPAARELQKIFDDFGKSTGGGGGGASSIFSSLIGAIAGSAGGGANANGSWGYGDWGAFGGAAGAASAGRGVNVYIDGATDRAQITSLVERGVKAGIAASRDSLARGGSGVFA